jgi:hypothetical protein
MLNSVKPKFIFKFIVCKKWVKIDSKIQIKKKSGVMDKKVGQTLVMN